MPRRFDYSRKPRTMEDGPFAPFEDLSPQGTEVPIEVMWHERLSFLHGRTPQFEFKPPEGVRPYDNDLVGPVYDWLVENVTGQWHWLEMEINHGHSVSTDLWIEDPSEHALFLEEWGHLFHVNEHRMERDLRVRSQTAVAPRP